MGRLELEQIGSIQHRLTELALFWDQFPELRSATDERTRGYVVSRTQDIIEPDGYRQGFMKFYHDAKTDEDVPTSK